MMPSKLEILPQRLFGALIWWQNRYQSNFLSLSVADLSQCRIIFLIYSFRFALFFQFQRTIVLHNPTTTKTRSLFYLSPHCVKATPSESVLFPSPTLFRKKSGKEACFFVVWAFGQIQCRLSAETPRKSMRHFLQSKFYGLIISGHQTGFSPALIGAS